MDISMKSEVLEVVKVIKKTKAKMFKDLKVGSRIQLSIPVKYAGGNRGTYASYITIRNLDNNECAFKSFNEVGILDNFEFKVV